MQSVENNQSQGSRFDQWKKNRRLKLDELAEAAGRSRAAIGAYTTGDTKTIPDEVLLALRDRFGLNPDWIKTGEGDMDISPAEALALAGSAQARKHLRDLQNAFSGTNTGRRLRPEDRQLRLPLEIPIVGDVAAGYPTTPAETPTELLSLEMFVPQDGKHYAATAKGGGAEHAGIRHGDTVIIRQFEPGEEPEDGDLCCLELAGDAVFKTVYVHKTNYELRDGTSFFRPKSEVKMIGRVVAMMRSYDARRKG